MGAFTGSLNANEIFSGIYNMIISQQVFADNIGKHQTLVDKARVDGGLFGDTKLYYATDALKSYAWTNDSEASNLLAINRPAAPSCQAITLDQFRQINITVDNYLTKRAWSNEGTFSQFISATLGWLRETKRIHDGTLYNVFVGTTETSTGSQNLTWTLTSGSEGQSVANELANLMVEMGDYSRKYNDYGYLRSYAPEEIKVIWNADYVNKIKYTDTPTIFHRDVLVSKLEGDILPARYFGVVITTSNIASYTGSGKVINASNEYDPTKGTIRVVKEMEKTISGTAYHYFPGDEIKSGATVKASGDFLPGEVYVEDATIICKIVTKLPPFMSAFETGTSFFNPRSLTENHYLTWGYNSLEYLKNYPFITVRKA